MQPTQRQVRNNYELRRCWCVCATCYRCMALRCRDEYGSAVAPAAGGRQRCARGCGWSAAAARAVQVRSRGKVVRSSPSFPRGGARSAFRARSTFRACHGMAGRRQNRRAKMPARLCRRFRSSPCRKCNKCVPRSVRVPILLLPEDSAVRWWCASAARGGARGRRRRRRARKVGEARFDSVLRVCAQCFTRAVDRARAANTQAPMR